MKIALDAMGGDNGSLVNVEGALSACKEWPEIEIVLVGKQSQIEQDLSTCGARQHPKISIQHTDDVVEMHESPVEACRSKPNSSIMLCARLHAERQVDAMVSAGNSGATMAASLFHLKRLEGISRPAIATILPTIDGHCVMLDMGANMDCKPKHLLQFAVMGAMYYQAIFKNHHPSVGLLSIGEEEGKGNELTLETYDLLKNSGLNFVGNVEGRDIPMGKSNVVVCDGFVGNVVLKFGEGLAKAILKLIKQEIKGHPLALAGGLLLKKGLSNIKSKVDPDEYGGAPLLGVNGISIVSHGGSSAFAIKNAIRVASELVKDGINQHIHDELKKTSSHVAVLS